MSDAVRQIWVPADGLCWCVDRQVTWVAVQDRMISLTGMERAVWGWMTLSYPQETLVKLLAEIQPENSCGAPAQLQQIVERWLADGLIKLEVA